jgi:hypothetical protein
MLIFRIFFVVYILTLSVACNAQNCASAEGTDFQMVRSSKGIMLFERWFNYDADLLAREIKAEMIVDTPADSIVALLQDSKRINNWNRNVEEVVIKKESSDSWVSYYRYDLPWPVDDQDCILRYTLIDRIDSIDISFQSIVDPEFPESKGVTRMKEVRGHWRLVKKNDSTKVEYRITTRPNQSLPRWLTDPIVRDNLFETMRLLHGQCQKS